MELESEAFKEPDRSVEIEKIDYQICEEPSADDQFFMFPPNVENDGISACLELENLLPDIILNETASTAAEIPVTDQEALHQEINIDQILSENLDQQTECMNNWNPVDDFNELLFRRYFHLFADGADLWIYFLETLYADYNRKLVATSQEEFKDLENQHLVDEVQCVALDLEMIYEDIRKMISGYWFMQDKARPHRNADNLDYNWP